MKELPRGFEYSKKPFKFSNSGAGFVTFKAWITDIKETYVKKSKELDDNNSTKNDRKASKVIAGLVREG